MTSVFFTVINGSSAVELCLLACNGYSLMISLYIYIYIYDNGLNFEHFCKEKGLKYWEIL